MCMICVWNFGHISERRINIVDLIEKCFKGSGIIQPYRKNNDMDENACGFGYPNGKEEIRGNDCL